MRIECIIKGCRTEDLSSKANALDMAVSQYSKILIINDSNRPEDAKGIQNSRNLVVSARINAYNEMCDNCPLR